MKRRGFAKGGWLALLVCLTALVHADSASGVDWSPWSPYLPVGGSGACSGCCFDDVIVSNAALFANDTYDHTGLVAGGRPTFAFHEWVEGQGPDMEDWFYRDGEIQYDSVGEQWSLFATYSWWYFQDDVVPGSSVGGVVYTNPSDALTPPTTGWVVSSSSDAGPTGDPRLSGGESCLEPALQTRNIKILPTGEAGDDQFLDRGLDLPEGEEPPMVGSLQLSSIYTVEEYVTGSCQILDADTERPVLSYAHVYIYEVDFGARPEGRTLLDHWMARHDWRTRKYMIEWDTEDLDPGYYDLYLSFENGTSECMRIELTPPGA